MGDASGSPGFALASRASRKRGERGGRSPLRDEGASLRFCPGLFYIVSRQPPAGPRRAGSRAQAAERHGASLDVVVAWLAATATAPVDSPTMAPDPARQVTVLLFAAPPDSGGMAPLGRAIDKRGGYHVAVDMLIGGCAHDRQDTTPGGVGWHLRRVRHSKDVCTACIPPFRARHSLLRSTTRMHAGQQSSPWRMGISVLPPPQRAEHVFMSNALVYFTLNLARDVIAAGHVTIENPVPRNDVSLPQAYWAAKAHHASLFRTRPILDYVAETRSVEIVAPLCAFGSPM